MYRCKLPHLANCRLDLGINQHWFSIDHAPMNHPMPHDRDSSRTIDDGPFPLPNSLQKGRQYPKTIGGGHFHFRFTQGSFSSDQGNTRLLSPIHQTLPQGSRFRELIEASLMAARASIDHQNNSRIVHGIKPLVLGALYY